MPPPGGREPRFLSSRGSPVPSAVCFRRSRAAPIRTPQSAFHL